MFGANPTATTSLLFFTAVLTAIASSQFGETIARDRWCEWCRPSGTTIHIHAYAPNLATWGACSGARAIQIWTAALKNVGTVGGGANNYKKNSANISYVQARPDPNSNPLRQYTITQYTYTNS